MARDMKFLLKYTLQQLRQQYFLPSGQLSQSSSGGPD
uniref:Uncharacterized protein n=1 Tax=Anguilla anguilla TaxID=7936 RepID=A0A0E9T646_ANGAN